MLKRNKLVLMFAITILTILFIILIDRWLTKNNPLSLDIGNKGCGIMRLNADGKQHIAQPPQPNSNRFLEKYGLKTDIIEEINITDQINQSDKETTPADRRTIERNKITLSDEMSKNIKTIDLTE